MTLPAAFPIYLPTDSTGPLAAVDHVASGLARLAQYLRDRPKLEAFLTVLLDQVQDLEDEYQEVYNDRLLAHAFGLQLDHIGELVGEPRQAFEDDDYRLQIKARVILNRSSGQVEDILSIFALMVPGADLNLLDQPPAAFRLRLDNEIVTADFAGFLVTFLRQGRAAGVRALLEFEESAEAGIFRFDAGPGFNDGNFASVLE